MELRDYVRVVRRRLATLALTLLLVVGGAVVYSLQATPEYESKARLFVSTSPSDTLEAYQGGLFAAQRVASYADLIKGQQLADRVADRLGLPDSEDSLAELVRAAPVPDTVVLELAARSDRPSEAQRIAQAYAEELVAFIDELETPTAGARPLIKATIVDDAAFNSEPVAPRTGLNVAIALGVGLLLGVCLAVVREMLDSSVKSNQDVSAATEAPMMGNIAFDSQAGKRPLITDLDSHAPRVEAFRVLRTNMQFVDVDGGNKIFVVSSSIPSEGKTTTAANLALTLASAGQRVLLVDGDLRRPRVADILGLEHAVGLTTVLLGRISINEAIQQDGKTGLDILTSGAMPPNPSELLQSHAMRDVLTDLRINYDIVIIDAPPLLPVTDAALLGSQSDGVLLVVRHGKTSRDQLRLAVERLENVGAKAIGVVMSMVPVRRGKKYGYGYGYGYGYAPEPRRKRSASGAKKAGASHKNEVEVGETRQPDRGDEAGSPDA